MAVVLPHVFADGDLILADEINDNFNTLVDGLTSVDGSQIDPNAGLRSTQLADRYAVSYASVELLPVTAGSSLATPTLFTIPVALTTVKKLQIVGALGRSMFLASIVIHKIAVAGGATGDLPIVSILLNGSTVGGAGVVMATDREFFVLAFGNAVDDPIVSLNDGDILTFQIGVDGADTDVTARGLSVFLTFKTELVS